MVSTRRLFRNAETQSIEAVMTFPVPVHATLFALEARIGRRLLVATAQRRDAARETYEDAVADGRTAILHEEVLRGVHMLSVAPLGPDAEVEVTARWVTTLAFIGGTGQVRSSLCWPGVPRQARGRRPGWSGGSSATSILRLCATRPSLSASARQSSRRAAALRAPRARAADCD